MTWWEPTDGYLMHHGIKGMKWGVRRYQNPDGSLTAAGKARYYRDDIKKGYRDKEGGITNKGIQERASKDELYKIAKSYEKKIADMGKDDEGLQELGELCVMELTQKYGNYSEKDFYKISTHIKTELAKEDPLYKKALDMERELSETSYAFYNSPKHTDGRTIDREWSEFVDGNKRLGTLDSEQDKIMQQLSSKYGLTYGDVYRSIIDQADTEHWKNQPKK